MSELSTGTVAAVSTDPTPCNNGVFREIAALAESTDSPVEPYPVFFNMPQCGAGSGTATSLTPSSDYVVTFPMYDDIAGSTGALRVIDFDPLGDAHRDKLLTADQVNVIGRASEGGTTTLSTLSPPNLRNFMSWFIPPGYKAIFFRKDPTKTIPENNAHLIQDEGSVMVDSCVQDIRLSDGENLFSHGIGGPGETPLSDACWAFRTHGDSPNEYFDTPTEAQGDTIFLNKKLASSARYLVIVKKSTFSRLILDMCVGDGTAGGIKEVSIGNTDILLNRTWKPQFSGCDNVLGSVCAVSGVSTDARYKDMCGCYIQKKAIDKIYGVKRNVSVCCFGFDADGDPKKACGSSANNTSYKSAEHLKHCCTFAQCQKVVNKSGDHFSGGDGNVNCKGTFVSIPKQSKPSTSGTPEVSETDTTNKTSIPIWVWIVAGITALFVIAFVMTLVAQRTGSKSPVTVLPGTRQPNVSRPAMRIPAPAIQTPTPVPLAPLPSAPLPSAPLPSNTFL